MSASLISHLMVGNYLGSHPHISCILPQKLLGPSLPGGEGGGDRYISDKVRVATSSTSRLLLCMSHVLCRSNHSHLFSCNESNKYQSTMRCRLFFSVEARTWHANQNEGEGVKSNKQHINHFPKKKYLNLVFAAEDRPGGLSSTDKTQAALIHNIEQRRPTAQSRASSHV